MTKPQTYLMFKIQLECSAWSYPWWRKWEFSDQNNVLLWIQIVKRQMKRKNDLVKTQQKACDFKTTVLIFKCLYIHIKWLYIIQKCIVCICINSRYPFLGTQSTLHTREESPHPPPVCYCYKMIILAVSQCIVVGCQASGKCHIIRDMV